MKNKRFGRADALFVFFLCLFWIVLLLGGVLQSWVLLILSLAPCALASFRIFSTSTRRKRENEIFLWLLFSPRRALLRRKFVYISCPFCGARLRFPRKKGRFRAHCPGCDGRFPITLSGRKEKEL